MHARRHRATAGQGEPVVEYLDYFPTALPPGIDSAELALAVASWSGGTSLVTAYVHVTRTSTRTTRFDGTGWLDENIYAAAITP